MVLGILLLTGLAIRLPHLADAPLEFHPTRQYRSAALARGYVIGELPGFSASPTAKWHIVSRSPDLVDVVPGEGTGPATLTLSLRQATAELDRTFTVDVFGEGQQVPAGSLTVRARAFRAKAPAPPFGFVDAPVEPVVLGDTPVVFQGWAMDDLSLRRVWVECRNGSGTTVSLGEAARGGMRADVAAANPDASDIYHSAWVFTLQPDALRGQTQPVRLRFLAEDSDGLKAEIGSRTVTVR